MHHVLQAAPHQYPIMASLQSLDTYVPAPPVDLLSSISLSLTLLDNTASFQKNGLVAWRYYDFWGPAHLPHNSGHVV